MRKRKIYDDKLQIDYFSDSYLKFEEDFYRYSAMDIPLTFLTDDIMREMAISQKNYFLLNKENARDGRNHYFHFEVSLVDSKTLAISIHAPARGATDDLLAFLGQDQDFNPRSREGSDLFLDQTPFYVVTFQSTLPRGERRKRSPRRQGYHHFNPRSREGSDQYGSHGHNSWQWISIHAPARGATCQALLFKISFQFQSTLPRGERRREKER